VEVIEKPYLYNSYELILCNISIRVIDGEIDNVGSGDPWSAFVMILKCFPCHEPSAATTVDKEPFQLVLRKPRVRPGSKPHKL
jgi:hypothetical protein